MKNMQGAQSLLLTQQTLHLSRRDVAVINWMTEQLKDVKLDPEFLEPLAERVETICGKKCVAHAQNVFVLEAKKAPHLFNDPTVFCQFDIPATDQRFFLALEVHSSREIIYGTLGLEHSPSILPLTDLERGVLQFFLLKLMQALQGDDRISLPRPVQISTVFHDATVLASLSTGSQVVYEVNLQIDQFKGKCFFIAGEDVLRSGSIWRQREIASHKFDEARASGACVPLIPRLGQTSIATSDLESLEIDDIIILESASIKLKDCELSGEVQCQIGTPERGLVLGRLFLNANRKYAIQVQEIMATAL